MSDRIRQTLAFVIAIGMVIGVASAPTLAQMADPAAEQVFELAALNADTVDGRHAVKYTTTRGKRAGKLVATNANGYLPSNILKPQWRVIQNMPASFTDGRIGWYEVANKPGGFADNVDDAGVMGIKLTRVAINDVAVPAGTRKMLEPICPGGSKVSGGGLWTSSAEFQLLRSQPISDLSGWSVQGYNNSGSQLTMSAYAVCLSAPGGYITTAARG